ncbi:MAG: acylphosphatase [Dehalococcoidia bacterium]|nr:MAG: acylphosphatase [Dehalococcoidia bacterium]
MAELAAFSATVHGHVQGVNFRYFVERHADALQLNGYVKNLSDGRTVEVRAEGEKEKLDELLKLLRTGPPRARVDRVDVSWSEFSGRFNRFGVSYY